jgi:hypothetical protein
MLAVIFLLIAQTASPGALVGRWDADGRSRGGLGQWLQLADDGTFTHTMGAMVDSTWRLEGQTLTITMEEKPGVLTSQAMEISLEKNTLRRMVNGRRVTMERAGGTAGETGLTGTWKYPYMDMAGATAYEQFLPDGRLLFRLPMVTRKGRYTVQGDTNSLAVGGSTTTRGKWRLAGDILELQLAATDAEPIQRFRREAAVPVIAK